MKENVPKENQRFNGRQKRRGKSIGGRQVERMKTDPGENLYLLAAVFSVQFNLSS